MSKKDSTPMSTTHNVLSPGTVITGNVQAEEDFRIDGSIDGNINCKGKIIVGENGILKGEVKCQNLDLMGKVKGIVYCSGTLTLRATATLEGEIKTKILMVEPGAKFTGSCDMASEAIEAID